MAGPRTPAWQVLGALVRRVVRALALFGGMHAHSGVQFYLELCREEARLRGADRDAPWPPHPPLQPPITLLPPPPGHPEQLVPDQPLSELELALRAELAHLDRLIPGENRR
ncbi:DUF6059 family protein [Kitasatospora sp. NPDC088134]|uniref:DUF6059 family protein n=1 Tax=Kitasatospora sp. NPDC088134 TaxID=3364071 RepID=UPI003828C4B6